MPTQTTAHCYPLLKKFKYEYERVEHRNFHTGLSSDFKKFGDILAWHPKYTGVLAIQACSESTFLDHRKKLVDVTDNIYPWLLSGNRLEIWCWCVRTIKNRKKRILRPISIHHYAPPKQIKTANTSSLLQGIQCSELTHLGYGCPGDSDLSGSIRWEPLDAKVKRPFIRSAN